MQSRELGPIPWWVMVLSALAIGLIAGFGAVLFRAMIGGLHNLLFLGQLSFDYDANIHTPASPWGPWIVLVPVIGALGVAFLVKTFAPEAKGHGVPEVMDAIYYHGGKIRAVVAAVKSVASALSIGSGGSVGREGPIIQIGAAFGSTVGEIIAMPARQRAILIAAGAGGGIAATFNTPIGGIVFAIELMLPFASPMSLLCVVVSCVTATCIGRTFFGVLPAFNVPALAVVEGPGLPLAVFPSFALFALLMGVIAWVTTRAIYWFEDLFDAMPGNYYTRHVFGMVLVGSIIYGFMTLSSPWFGQPNHYYVQGVGYATIMDILRSEQSAVGFLLLLAFAKLLVTCLTLGSGASGGVFSPSMFVGAALGAAFGAALNRLFPSLAVTPVHFAFAGMAAMIGGTTGALVTAVVMTFEMTRDYTTILPVILTVAIANAVRQWLSPSTIYTLKLLRRGHVVPQGLQAWMGELRSKDVLSPDFLILAEEEAAVDGAVRHALVKGQVVLLTRNHEVCGVIDVASQLDSLDRGLPPSRAAHVLVEPGHRFHEVLRAMDTARARIAIVTQLSATTGKQEVLGVVTEREIAKAASAAAKLAG
ncbi:MAG TPA: chloride channel protein [Gemmataceae bacterium]|nr:chloride channel protein [Gemmataceae bacterium]